MKPTSTAQLIDWLERAKNDDHSAGSENALRTRLRELTEVTFELAKRLKKLEDWYVEVNPPDGER